MRHPAPAALLPGRSLMATTVDRTSIAGRRWIEVHYRDQRDYACHMPTGYYWEVIQGHPMGCWPAQSGFERDFRAARDAANTWKDELDRRAALRADPDLGQAACGHAFLAHSEELHGRWCSTCEAWCSPACYDGDPHAPELPEIASCVALAGDVQCFS